MDLSPSATELAFRDDLRAWLEANHPGPAPTGEVGAFDFARAWQRRLAAAGWAGVHWPVEYGGRGATVTESAIFFAELARARAPLPANTLGLLLGGPTLMVWGTQAQKERHLPPILSADEIWCQGFSEPDAGSDLAALKTRAVFDPAADEWVVTGQKVWTSGAQVAKWCMLLARTDAAAPKHSGLTYFLMDMEQDAVQVRPIVQITGEAPFNELFIDGARIPAANVVGGVGNGWKVALTTLMNERAGLAFFVQARLRQVLDDLFDEAAARGLLDDPLVADRLAELHVKCEVLRLTSYRGLARLQSHGQPGPEGSLAKLMWSQCSQQLSQLAIELLGPSALTADSPWSFELLRTRGNSIEGGTSEILKGIVAERVLGLPRRSAA
jgi:alkylation response protein AidB-like acyl-CoA dehydrogenase